MTNWLSPALRGFLCGVLPVLGACSAVDGPGSRDVQIRWTDHDVPHIQADNYESLGFGYGFVLARDRLCESAGRTIVLRGERSRYYGPDGVATVGFLRTTNLNSDLAIRLRMPDDWVASELAALQDDTRNYIRGVAAGMNHYVEQLPVAQRARACGDEPVPVFRDTDIVRSAMRFGVMKELVDIGPVLVDSASAWTPAAQAGLDIDAHARPVEVEGGFGSNAWVYGGDVAAGSGALMLANPHSAWERRPHQQRIYMHQVHLTIPGELDVAGSAFLGIPTPLTGYNADVAWTILDAATVSPYVLQAMDVQASASPPTYRVDGETRPLDIRPVTLEVLSADNTVTRRTFHFAHSELGVLYKLPDSPGRPAGWYAITNAGERNASGLDQFLAVARAGSTPELIRAVAENRGILSQLLVADRHGDVGYVVAGAVLPISDEAMSACHVGDSAAAFKVVDGSRGDCAFRDAEGRPLMAPADFYPDIVSRGILHNTNNSYKYTEHGRAQAAYPSVFGQHVDSQAPGQKKAAGLRFDPRLEMSARRMAEVGADGRVTPEEALDVIFDNRNYAAETFLDDVLAVCESATVAETLEGCSVLSRWDRKNDADSRGALLFNRFWGRVVALDQVLPFDATGDPEVAEPIAISPLVADQLREALAASVAELRGLGFAPDEAWGRVLYATADGERIALHGGSYQEGVLNGEMPAGLTRDGFSYILFGTVYVQRVSWQEGQLLADVLLAHGQREDVDSAGRSAQLRLFADKQLYRPPFAAGELEAATIIETRVLSPTGSE